ncbi:hypothetical protein FSP39_014604 [Pinctada imbricata]|uniref:Bicarbonate transporter-like transmembrane domain-containing protein n=1 Tax=Pinctada imbricata TaxID=66713 RepID=A0AA88Y7I7_PINIB|nr:hypothetical protein FSP39_014604 [Pinctada imbricata]
MNEEMGDNHLSLNGHLSVDKDASRRRHKSESAVPASPTKSTGSNGFLNPNYRKGSMYESRSTISGVKFDDPFIDETGLTLMYSRHEKVPLKDFSMEVRAAMDIQKYLNRTVLLLNMNKVSLDEIIDDILHKMLDGSGGKHSFDQARSALFTHDCVHQLSRTLQCTSVSEGGGFDYDQNWICAMASVPSIQTRHVGIGRLRHPANLGTSSQEVQFVVVVLTPTKEKGTKNELETGRSFATIFSDVNVRLDLLEANTEEEFKRILGHHANSLAEVQKMATEKVPIDESDVDSSKCRCGIFRGIRDDLRRRLPVYVSDYVDGIVGPKTLQKTISTTFFLYFACLMPSIAFGVLNENNTKGWLNVEKVLYSQTMGGLFFAIFGGTPHVVLLTTAPLALYTKIIYSICEDFDIDFPAMYCCVGLWNSLFLFLYSIFDLSILMQWSTRSSEEIFALFISIAFCVDAFKDTARNFGEHYNLAACSQSPQQYSQVLNASNHMSNGTTTVSSVINVTMTTAKQITDQAVTECERDNSLLYLLLLFGTLWLGVTLYNFTKTPYLNAGKREILADYALPVAVIVMSFFGSYVFRDVNLGKSFTANKLSLDIFQLMPLYKLSIGAIFGAMGLGFCLSLLFFMDQNISAALVNSPSNKLKKGTAYHWDLLVCGFINAGLSLLVFPLGPCCLTTLSPTLKVRETRLTCILSHLLIGLSLLALEYLAYIPTPVLYGLFLYVGVTSLYGNQMFERVMLLFTEQSAYPPNHYIRRVPQRKMHLFTMLQLLQLVVLCGFGFAPYAYLKMFFPVLIFLLIPLRHKVIPHAVDQKFLKAMDSH